LTKSPDPKNVPARMGQRELKNWDNISAMKIVVKSHNKNPMTRSERSVSGRGRKRPPYNKGAMGPYCQV
jgi:hypothetical protein